MNVTYKPADGEARSWPFDPALVRAAQAEMIEKRAGQRFDEWSVDVLAGSAKARRVLLWHLMTREHPAFRFEDVPDFAMGEVTIERDLGELLRFREQVEKSKVDEELRLAALSEIDDEIVQRRAAGDPEPGKA